MIDVNQQWNINTAMTWGKRLEEFDLYWLEEPLNPDDVLNHRKLADALNVPIALGEHVYSKYAFRDYIHQGAVEYVQVDVTRVGSITEWQQVAGLAASYDLPIWDRQKPSQRKQPYSFHDRYGTAWCRRT
ncbi:enolase C-terminal domain-like protein [Paenibacillus spongiae]